MLRPTAFGKYCLLERVSVGGMAEVYRARPFNAPGFRRYLAVKRILPNLAEDDEFISMFVDEAKIAVQLHHRNVCQIYELGRNQGSYYIVMEYIAGKDLLQIQNRFRTSRRIMSVTQALYIAANICEGLDYAHRKVSDEGRPLHIVHRDISPQNILISYDGEVKVIDFGIARAATKNQQTQVGVLKGKFGYMSPEQVGGAEIDHRSDIFAVGTLLWEMLTARRLFHAESDFETLERVRSDEILPPSARNRRVPAEVDEIVMRALQRDPDQRYAWASDMAADLRRVVESVTPPYDGNVLSQWMVRAWPGEIGEEAEKAAAFAPFVTHEDVTRYNDATFGGGDLEGVEELDMDALVDATRVASSNEVAAVSDGEVLAESEDEPMATVVLNTEGMGLPDLDAVLSGGVPAVDVLGDLDEATVADARVPALIMPMATRRSGVPLVIGALILAIAAVGGWLVWQKISVSEAAVEPAATGTVTVTVMPPEALTVQIGDRTLQGSSPLVFEGVAFGPATVEIAREGFTTVSVDVDVTGDTPPVVVQLEAESGTAGVRLRLDSPSAQVYLDGMLVGGQGSTRDFSVRSGESHTVEIFQPGHFVETFSFSPRTGERFEREVTLRAVRGSVTVGSEPAGEVFLDGQSRGTTGGGVTVSNMDPIAVHTLEIRPLGVGFRPYNQVIVFDTYYDMSLHPRLPRIGASESGTLSVPWGNVTTDGASRWYRVFVDGRDSGLVTPITADAPLPLRAGERSVSFIRADAEYTVTVVVEDGGTVHIPLPDL